MICRTGEREMRFDVEMEERKAESGVWRDRRGGMGDIRERHEKKRLAGHSGREGVFISS